MSCSENITPCGCGSDPCGCKISSDDVAYQGADLSCTGVVNCDTLTEAIQKIDEYACSIDMVQNIINNITNNISLYNQFITIVNQTVDCQTIFNCLETTTTTTTATPIPAYCYFISAIGRVTFYWLDVNGDPQVLNLLDSDAYICARLDSIATSGLGLSEIDGGIDLCTSNSQCIPTTTTTTTACIPSTIVTNISTCDSYTWDVTGLTYTDSDEYSYTIGCVSYILNLTICSGPTYQTYTQEVTAVGSYTWPINNGTYTFSGTYSYELGPTIDGGDCVYYLILTII